MVPDQQVIVTVNPSSAKVHILCVSEDIMSEPFRENAMEDERATNKDMVRIYRCFRPGDIVLTRVIFLRDTKTVSLLRLLQRQ